MLGAANASTSWECVIRVTRCCCNVTAACRQLESDARLEPVRCQHSLALNNKCSFSKKLTVTLSICKRKYIIFASVSTITDSSPTQVRPIGIKHDLLSSCCYIMLTKYCDGNADLFQQCRYIIVNRVRVVV